MNSKILIKRASMMLFVFMLCAVAFAQKTIKGTVKDASGDPIIGANVLEKGTNNGTITDFEGNYTISGVKNNATLVVSYIGYLSQEVKVAGQSNIDVKLQEDTRNLEEVVVVGYGTVKKKDLTGSVASVSTADLGKVAGANALQAMQAKVPGVDLQQSDGEAGAGVSMKLRGNRSILANNDPLVIVDGVEYGSTLDIPASDIESMDILKDAASTAIYGTKGANGVIIITTKRGNAGKTSVGFNAYLSFNSPTGVTKTMYGTKEVQRLIDAANYKTASANGWDFSKGNATAESVIGTDKQLSDGTKLIDIVNDGSYTDWFDLILCNSTSQNYEVSVNGGNQNTNFNVSLSFMDDKGLMKNDDLKRYTGRANIDHSISKYVKIGTSLSFAYKSNDKRNSGNYSQALKMTTITHAYLTDGTINKTPSRFYEAHSSPLLDDVDGAYQRNIESTRFFGSAYLQLNPIENLMLKSNFTADINHSRDGLYQDFESQGRLQSPSTTYISNDRENTNKFVWQNTANYSLNVDKHDVSFLLGHEMTQSVYEQSNVYGTAGSEHYYTGSFYDVSKIASPTAETSYVKSSMVSFFGRVNYSFDSKYLLQASLRSDGSSVLAKGHKWGTFPSVSAGWRITEESFMDNAKSWLDNLKFRVSWGLSGNAAISEYQTLATISSIVPNSTDKAPMTLANDDLTWEKTSAFDLGLDFSFVDGRINGTIDYYHSNTYDLLYYLSAPASSVFTSSIYNVGETKGHGWEFAVNFVPVRTKDFSWDINTSATFARDEVSKLRDGLPSILDAKDGISYLEIGKPLSSYYTYEVDGCWNIGEFDTYNQNNYNGEFTKPNKYYGDPGTPKVIDQNHDGKIDDNDKIVYGRSPKAILGMTNTFSYKNWSLSIQMMARLGGYMKYDGYNKFTYDDSNWADLSYWTPTNTDAVIPTPGTDSSATTNYVNAICMQKSNYFKVKDITLSYNFDKSLLSRSKFLNSARIYCSLKNFIYSSKIDGYDSERGGSVTFPLAKQVVVGVNLTL